MHYKNGREVKVGDKVVGADWQRNPVAGIVVAVAPGSTTCNISIVPTHPHATYNSDQFLHVDDALPLPVPVPPEVRPMPAETIAAE